MRFVLVHGGAHGAWCWQKTEAELRQLGHETEAVELPGHGTRVGEKSTLAGYGEAVVDRLQDGDVLVGHSMGGNVISVAADTFPGELRHLIYLAAGVPIQGKSMVEVTPHDELGISEHYIVEEGPHGPEFRMDGLAGATKYFFHDCPPDVAEWAYEQLTPQQFEPVSTPIELRRFWELKTPRSFILCTDDQAGPIRYTEDFLRRLRISSVYPIWASHSPFLSRPRDTAELLAQIAAGDGGTPEK